VDVPVKHSALMRAVRGRGNKTTEMRFRGALARAGRGGWRTHRRAVPGCPDLLFHTERVAVFLDGCFWHGCPNCGHVPKQNTGFWKAKIERNRERDRANGLKLEAAGFAVVRFWEHEVQGALGDCVQRLVQVLDERSAPRRKDE
jgi:DNA mismatch endonuclease Vsr